jgi:DNA polymerase I
LSPRKKSSPLSVPDAANTVAPHTSLSAQKLKIVSSETGCIFLIDTMSFIFRAYHAMARQRGMSTKTGLPTAATYVFVNMLRKLRDDFSPEYLAAVFDVAAPTFRDQQAEGLTSVRRFDLKTQTFKEIE